MIIELLKLYFFESVEIWVADGVQVLKSFLIDKCV